MGAIARLEDLSIRTKLIGVAFLSVLFALGLSFCIDVWYERRFLDDLIAQTLSTQAEIADYNCRAPLTFHDPQSATETLGALRADPTVLAAVVFASDGAPFASYRRADHSARVPDKAPEHPGLSREAGRLSVVRRIVMEGSLIGTLWMVSDLTVLDVMVQRSARAEIIAMLLAGVVALMMASRLQLGILRRIQRLADVAGLVRQERNYAVRVEAAGRDEVGQLMDDFNEMLGQIQTRDAELASTGSELMRANRELERRVAERTAQLEDANRELEAFSYSVAHDLRAPLRHVDGFAGLLARHAGGSLDDKGRRYLDTIGASIKDMGVLIDTLLAFSRLGRADLKKTAVSLSGLVEGVRAELSEAEPGRQVAWRVAPLPDVEADEALLKIVFTNLLSNALKYTRKQPSPEVEILCQPGEADDWVITVADNGAGFDMRYTDKLFGVFQRLHNVEEFEGTGIGLASVRRIVGRHGGRVWAEGVVDQGARFHFTLPRREGTNTR